MTAQLAGMLEELGREWFVELETALGDGQWRLQIIHRTRGFHPLTWTGTLTEVVVRAHSTHAAPRTQACSTCGKVWTLGKPTNDVFCCGRMQPNADAVPAR